MAHHEPQNLVRLVETVELVGVRYLAAEDLRVVLARHHGLRPGDERGEEPVEFFEVHGPAALAAFEEGSEAVKLGVGQRVVLGEGLHGNHPQEAAFVSASILHGNHSAEPSILISCPDPGDRFGDRGPG